MKESVVQKSINEEHAKVESIAVNVNESKKTSKSVQSMNDVSKQRTLVSARRMEKIMKSGESVYLAIFQPSAIQQKQDSLPRLNCSS